MSITGLFWADDTVRQMNSTGPINITTTQKSKPSSPSSVRISFKSQINSSSPLSSTNSSASVTVRSLWICSGLKWQRRTKLILWLVSPTASFTMKSPILDLSIDLNSAQPSQDKSVWGRVLCFYNFPRPSSLPDLSSDFSNWFSLDFSKDFYRHKIRDLRYSKWGFLKSGKKRWVNIVQT